MTLYLPMKDDRGRLGAGLSGVPSNGQAYQISAGMTYGTVLDRGLP